MPAPTLSPCKKVQTITQPMVSSQWSPWPSIYWYGVCINGVIETGGAMLRISDISHIFFFLYLLSRETQCDTHLKSLLWNYLDSPRYYLLSNDSISRTIILTWPWTFVFPDYALFSNHDCGCVCQSAWESLTICFFIVSISNIIPNTQTFRYLVRYLVKSTKELLENWRNEKPNTSTNSMFTEFQTYFIKQKLVFKTHQLDSVWL